MDSRERVYDPEETLRMAFESMISRVWCALPGVVQAVTNGGNTVEVQPAINLNVRQLDGTYTPMQMPKLVDVPICWQGGGGATWTFPVSQGDECLLVFASRCIDAWWAGGFATPTGQTGADGAPVNAQNTPPEFRMHNISDGFALVGVRSMARKLATFNTTTARLRTDDNSCYFEFDPVNKAMKMVASGGVTINGVTIDTNGNVVSPATITGNQVIGSGVHLTTHTHSGVQSGGSNTGAPVAGS